MSNDNTNSNSDSNNEGFNLTGFALQKYKELLETIDQAEQLNTLDVFMLNQYAIKTLVLQIKRNARHAFSNLEIFTLTDKEKKSKELAQYIKEFLLELNKLQTTFYNSSNFGIKKSPGTSYIFEAWRLFLILSREITILSKSVNVTNLGLPLNWDHKVDTLKISRENEKTEEIKTLLEDEYVGDLKFVKDKIYGILSPFKDYHHRYYIHEGNPMIFKPFDRPDKVEKAYQKVKSAHNLLVKMYVKLESVNSLNHLSLKMRTLELLGDTLECFLRIINALQRIIDVDPLWVIQLYLEENPNLNSNLKEMVIGVKGLMELLIKRNGIINEKCKAVYRDVHKRLTNLPCDPKLGETLSILEMDKMNLACFDKIPDLTSFDLIMLDALKGLFIKLSYTFNGVYEKEFKMAFLKEKIGSSH